MTLQCAARSTTSTQNGLLSKTPYLVLETLELKLRYRICKGSIMFLYTLLFLLIPLCFPIRYIAILTLFSLLTVASVVAG